MEKGLEQTASHGPNDYSLFAEGYKKRLAEIAELERRIGQRRKFVRTETNEGRRETAQKIWAEIEALQEELSTAKASASIDLVQHRQSTHYLEKLNPENMHQA